MAKRNETPQEDDNVRVILEGEDAEGTPPAESAETEGGETAESDEGGDDDHDDDASAAADEDDESLIDAATQEKRERRRLERQSKRQYAREKEERMRLRLESQERLIREQTERLAALERKDVSHDLSQLDQRITQASMRAKQAEQALQKAIATGDGQLHTQAMKVWYESSREAESLANYKNNLVRAAQRPVEQAPDPIVRSMAEQWAARNPWYDPAGRDEDSKMAYDISARVSKDGYHPNDPSYWHELDARLQKYLPHRIEQRERQAVKAKPRAPVGGSGRDSRSSSGAEEFTLSRERIAALKLAGEWNDPDARKAAINAYRQYDKAQRR